MLFQLITNAIISKEEDVKWMVDETVKRYGRLDTLFNIAGIAHARAKLHEFPKDEWDRIIAINLTGTYLCCKEALKIMVRQKSGKIINTKEKLVVEFKRKRGGR